MACVANKAVFNSCVDYEIFSKIYFSLNFKNKFKEEKRNESF